MRVRRNEAARLTNEQWATNVLIVVSTHAALDKWTADDWDICHAALVAQRAKPAQQFELILDDPFSARWRLLPSTRDGKGVRLHEFRRIHGDRPDDPAVTAVNAALAELDAP